MNERYWRTVHDPLEFLSTSEDASSISIMSSAVILDNASLLMEFEIESIVMIFSSVVDVLIIFWIISALTVSLFRILLSYFSNFTEISFSISGGVFALEISSLRDFEDEYFFMILRFLSDPQRGQPPTFFELDPKYLPHSHLIIAQRPSMNLRRIAGSRV